MVVFSRSAARLLALLSLMFAAAYVDAAVSPKRRVLVSAEHMASGSILPRGSGGIITMPMEKRIIESAERINRPNGNDKRDTDMSGGTWHFHEGRHNRFHRRRPIAQTNPDVRIYGRQTNHTTKTSTGTSVKPTASVYSVGEMNVPLLWNDIMYVVDFRVNDEGPFPLLVDTGSANSWVATSKCKGCNSVQMKTVQNFTFVDDCWTLHYGSGVAVSCFGKNRIEFNGFAIDDYWMLGTIQVDQQFMNFPYTSGIWGLGMTPLSVNGSATILDTLLEAGAITNPEVGFWLPPVGQTELTLGGADPSHWDEPSGVSLPNVDLEAGFYKITLDDVLVNGTALNFGSRQVILDSGSTFINGPATDYIAIFTALLGHKPDYWQSKDGTQQVYILPCATPPGAEWPLAFRFGGKHFPMHYSSLISGPIESGSDQCFSAISGDARASARWILGDRFLHNVYHTVNIKTGQVRMSLVKRDQ